MKRVKNLKDLVLNRNKIPTPELETIKLIKLKESTNLQLTSSSGVWRDTRTLRSSTRQRAERRGNTRKLAVGCRELRVSFLAEDEWNFRSASSWHVLAAPSSCFVIRGSNSTFSPGISDGSSWEIRVDKLFAKDVDSSSFGSNTSKTSTNWLHWNL